MKKCHRINKIGLLMGFLALAYWGFQLEPVAGTKTEQYAEELYLTLPARPVSDLAPDKPTFQATDVYISDIKVPEFSFDAISLEWHQEAPEGTNMNVLTRFEIGGVWTDWEYVDTDIDFQGDHEHKSQNGHMNGFMLTDRADKFQYKVELSSTSGEKTPSFGSFKYTVYNSSGGPDPIEIVNPKALLSALKVISTDKSKIVSRKDWGADESLRIWSNPPPDQPESANGPDKDASDEGFQSGNSGNVKIVKVVENNAQGEKYLWPLEYPDKVNRFVIHHTATRTDGELADPKAALRSIYNYHAVTRGWGDIGYNYIIDQNGVIYQGRFGDEGVVGGHAGPANKGSIGIAVIGNYQEKDPPAAVIQSLMDLIVEKSKLHKITPNGFSYLQGELTPNIVGHKDVMDTSCPGTKLYDKLPYVRLLAGREINAPTFSTEDKYAFSETSDRAILVLDPESEKNVEIILKNTGSETWTNKTYLVHDKNDLRVKIVDFRYANNAEMNLAYLKEKSVKTGEKGTFSFKVSSQLAAGLTNYHLFPIFEGSQRSKNSILLPIFVEAPELRFTIFQTALPSGKGKVGQSIDSGWVKLQNTSSISWTKEGRKKVCITLQSSGECIGFLEQEEVKPLDIAFFKLSYKPVKSGLITENLLVSMPEFGRVEGPDLNFTLNIEGQTYLATMLRQNFDNIFKPGETKEGWIEVKNIGELGWANSEKNPLKIFPLANKEISVFNYKIPPGKVETNQAVKIYFSVTAPKQMGNFSIYFWPRLGRKGLSKSPFKYNMFVTNHPERYTLSERRDLDIRILIGYKNGNPKISSDNLYKLYFGQSFQRNVKANEVSEVSYDQNMYRVMIGREALVSADPPRFVPDTGGIMQLTNHDNVSSWDKSIVYNRFRGLLEVDYDTEEKRLIVVNELPIEEYLRGLAEAPTDEKLIEKAKAITVAARTYALWYMDEENRKFPGKPYDGNDDPAVFQYYLGYEFEQRAPAIVKAVEETQGQVVTYRGKLVKTPYFSSSDGRTRSAEEGFGWKQEDYPYLVSVPDPYCEGKELRGHGVGMSGCGAEGAALAGKAYIPILQYYYRGTRVEKKY